jgi:hypothetical protein
MRKFQSVLVVLTVAMFLGGCVGGQLKPGVSQGLMTGAAVFNEGVKWVMGVTDELAPSLCGAGVIGVATCASYPLASASLKVLTNRIDAAVVAYAVSGSPADAAKVEDLKKQAEVIYQAQVEPVYKGQDIEVTQ